MACQRSAATALTAAAFLTGLPLNAWAEEAENSTMAASSLRGSNDRRLQIVSNDPVVVCKPQNQACRSNGCCCAGLECAPSGLLDGPDRTCQERPYQPPRDCNFENHYCRSSSFCCAGLECRENKCLRPYSPPAYRRNTCREIGCGWQGYRGDECECIEECVQRGTCCSDFYSFCRAPAPEPWPTPAPAPPPMTQGRYIEWSFDRCYCMSVDSNRFQNGQRMQLWHCSGGSGQYFQFDPYYSNSPSLLRASADTRYCVVINGNHNENGAFAQLWECDSNVQAQHWIRQSGRGGSMLLRNYAFQDKCLVVDSNRGRNGQKLQLWSCDEWVRQYQTWTHYGF